jgi:DNA-directed RNA polymerase II subunit RPB9
LYPEENKENQKLQYICRTCSYKEDAETTCIFRHELANTVGDTAGITQDIGEDPTVGNDSSNDPNADFYAQQHSSFANNYDMDVAIAPNTTEEVPDMCTMCGQEIFCETCGLPSDRGCFLEVHEDQAEQFAQGMMTPVSIPSEMETSQQLQQLRIQQDQDSSGQDGPAS